MAKISMVADQNAARTGATPGVLSCGPPEFDLDLLLHLDDTDRTRRWRWCLGASLALHALIFVVALGLKSVVAVRSVNVSSPVRIYTKLYVPPDVLTQRAPNTRRPSKTFDLADLLAAQ